MARAIKLAHCIVSGDHLDLHWGVAIIRFSLFRELNRTIGRLGCLQTELGNSLIVGQMLEKYDNQSTISRAVA